MAEQKIEFRKVRDSGACVTDAFVFMRQEAAPLLKCVFAICTVFLLAGAIYTAFYYSNSVNLMASMLQGGTADKLYLFRTIGTQVTILSVLNLFTFASLQVVLGAYVKYYVENKQTPGIEEVWAIFKQYFLKVCLFQIPLFISIFVGLCFCIIPGIYLGIVLMPFSLIVMIEDKGFFSAYGRCFDIITNNFWVSAGAYLLGYLLYLIGPVFISIVLAIAGKLISFTTLADMTTSMGIVSSFLNVFSFVFISSCLSWWP